MFTGIIEEVGVVERIEKNARSMRLRIKADRVTENTQVGDSIAVNGVCLTATGVDGSGFSADVMDETYLRSSLSNLSSGDRVNLERAMRADGRFGGHIVAGHVEGIGSIRSVKKQEMAVVYEIALGAPDNSAYTGASGREKNSSEALMRYIIPKGSIAIDGISLTVASVGDDSFSVSIIPHTIENTTLKDKHPGDVVNLEADIIGRYVERLMSFSESESTNRTKAGHTGTGRLSGEYKDAEDFLMENGFL
ncbi:MAG: riboflavin synthase [Eubacterium sp.]|nr:riboflavin synthase [Eubacterium sp.]